MKNKALLLTGLVGLAAVSANAGVHWNISIGLPVPVIVSTPCPPPPPPAPPVVVVTAPPCQNDYVWVAGYWAPQRCGQVWVPGGWRPRPAYYAHRHFDHDHRW